jgi:RNA polymerase sigma factor (sigma-70 family)
MAPAADQPPRGLILGGHPVEESDAELLSRIARRDREAFELFYRRYVRAVYALALSRLGDRDRAGEATRQTFAAIWDFAATGPPERGDGARWLFAVAANAIDERRQRRAEPRSCDEVLEVEPQLGPESPSADGWPAFRVHAAVMGLPEEQRVPIELFYWKGRSQSEIAEELGLSIGTVRANILSALAHPATTLENAASA